MNKERLTAFSDGVIAIIITIMVLELKVPHTADWSALATLLPVFLSYVMSFLFVAIYWNNHHHLLHACKRVNGVILGRTGSEVTMIPEFANHLINSGGKRLRPMLTLALARLAG